jgi:hypothetical protein
VCVTFIVIGSLPLKALDDPSDAYLCTDDTVPSEPIAARIVGLLASAANARFGTSATAAAERHNSVARGFVLREAACLAFMVSSLSGQPAASLPARP